MRVKLTQDQIDILKIMTKLDITDAEIAAEGNRLRVLVRLAPVASKIELHIVKVGDDQEDEEVTAIQSDHPGLNLEIKMTKPGKTITHKGRTIMDGREWEVWLLEKKIPGLDLLLGTIKLIMQEQLVGWVPRFIAIDWNGKIIPGYFHMSRRAAVKDLITKVKASGFSFPGEAKIDNNAEENGS